VLRPAGSSTAGAAAIPEALAPAPTAVTLPAPTARDPFDREVIERPESVRVIHSMDAYLIEWAWQDPDQRRSDLRIALSLPAFLVGVALLLGLGGLIPLALLIAYGFFAYAFNRTSVRIGDGMIRVTNRPFPWPEGRNVRLADIEDLYMEKTWIHSEDADAHASSRLCVKARVHLKPSGKKATLFSEPTSGYDQRVLFVLQELRREIASGRWSRS
jgi:hypothetical protein